MDTQELLINTGLLQRPSLATIETRDSGYDNDNANETLAHLANRSKLLVSAIYKLSDFTTKYDMTSKHPSNPVIYVFTVAVSRYFLMLEAFPVVTRLDVTSAHQVEELVYHSLFEGVIKRYTKVSQKPNPVLRDTRASDFCYRLTVKVEAVPHETLKRVHRLVLLREFLILQHLWESYHSELMANVCGPDQLIGFPMPFEFTNVVGSEFDLPDCMDVTYYSPCGKLEAYGQAPVPSILPCSTSATMASSLSYMSYERLGPSLSYLMDIMQTQNKALTVSTALKVYDQLISRLMVMHRYGVVHCDPNPACLFFGPGETCNVLYISEFGTAIVNPELGMQVKRFHDRFVSYRRVREKQCHYVNDLESAFYIFLFLIMGRMPWDVRMADNAKQSMDSVADPDLVGKPNEGGLTEISVTQEVKEKFWNSPDILNRAFSIIDLEFSESLYQSFSVDLIESLYSKTKEIITSVSRIPLSTYVKEVLVPGSQVYNFYFGLRRIISTYFRFETLNPALRDVQCASKVELLNRQCKADMRHPWDLSHWCWNYLDTRFCPPPKPQGKSKMAD